MKMQILQRGSVAPVVYHLCPLMTYSSPSRTIDACTLVASLDATAGSVIAKHERISPARSGVSQRACCSGVPYSMSVSMLPVSGALQLKHSGREQRAPHDLAQVRVLEVGETAVVMLGGHEQVPQSRRPRLGLELLDDRIRLRRARAVSASSKYRRSLG